MKKQRMPPGWTQKKILDLAAHHDQQSEDEQAAQIEAAVTKKGQTLMVVPTKLVPKIQSLIRKMRPEK